MTLRAGEPVRVRGLGRIHLGIPVTGETGEKRVPVRLGRSSVNAVEVLSGLNPGDTIILSDMSPWDAHDRLRLN